MSLNRDFHTNHTKQREPHAKPNTPAFITRLRDNPEALVGHTLVADCLRRGYNENGYGSLRGISDNIVRESNDDNTIFIYETTHVLGEVTDYNSRTDTYTVVTEGEYPLETGKKKRETNLAEGDDAIVRHIPAEAVRTHLTKNPHRTVTPGEWWVEL